MSVYISASKEYIKIRQTILDAENQHFLSYVVWNFVVPVVNLAISLRVFKKQKGLFISEDSEQPTDTAEGVSNNRSRLTASVKQEAQLSQRSRATLRVA